jgi:hypothetical protein|tara:strand:+ start:141 stop:590 length:450 start_codon:yes stop_codon:yes gene_type:complete
MKTMKKMIFTLTLGLLIAVGVNAQSAKSTAGDWYLGTGNIANTAWTDWSVSPSIGYGITDDLMVGLNISQVNSDASLSLDLHSRYFLTVAEQDLFVYASSSDVFAFDDLNFGIGKMFSFHKGSIYVDPKVVYSLGDKTTNLELGLGLKF